VKTYARPFATAALIAAAIGAGGCGSDDKKADSTGAGSSSQATGAASPSAKVAFVAPTSGASEADSVKVKVKLTGFKIDPKSVGKAPRPGVGHLHFAMDGGKFDNGKHSGPNGELAEKLGVDGKYSPSLAPTITYSDLPPGKHELTVFLANNNHTATGIEAKTEFTVK
jgi:hypothetical protein